MPENSMDDWITFSEKYKSSLKLPSNKLITEMDENLFNALRYLKHNGYPKITYEKKPIKISRALGLTKNPST
jgi:hypothetical protein